MSAQEKNKTENNPKKTKDYWSSKDPSNYLMNLYHSHGEEIVVVCYEETIHTKIIEIKPFEIVVEGKEEPIHKTSILYFYLPKFHAAIERMIRSSQDVKNKDLKPLVGKEERYQINKNSLHKAYKDKQRIMVTMRNGDTIHGIVHRYGIFSVNLSLPRGIKVIVMNHGLYDLKEMNREPSNNQRQNLNQRY